MAGPAPDQSGEVKAFDAYGEKISLPAKDVPALIAGGGRVATKQEVAEDRLQRVDEERLGPLAALQPHKAVALYQGLTKGADLGISEMIQHKVLEQVAPGLDKDIRRGRELLREAHPDLSTAGEIGGMVASTVATGGLGAAAGAAKGAGLARLIPSAAIGAAGEAAGQAVARGTAGLAAKGVLGKAASTALSVGAQGAVEGALYGAAHQVSEDVLGDHQLNGEKLFVAAGTGALFGMGGGAVLGGAGSLIKIGASGLSRVVRGAEEKVGAIRQGAASLADDVAAVPARVAEGIEHGAAKLGVNAGQETGAIRKFLNEGVTDASVRSAANDRAWRALNPQKKFAEEAARYLPNGTDDVGEALIRHRVIDKEGGLVKAMLEGSPADIAPRVVAKHAEVGQKIGSLRDGLETGVSAEKLSEAFKTVADQYKKKFGPENKRAAAAVMADFDDMAQTLGVTMPGQTAKAGETAGASLQGLIDARQAYDGIIYSSPLANKLELQARREARDKLESLIVDSLETEAKKAGNDTFRKELTQLKRDYQALSIAKNAVEDAAVRGTRNASLSLTDAIAAGGAVAGGHILAAPVVALGSQVLRQRGNAAAAVLLSRMADTGAISQALRKVDDQIVRSAKAAVLPAAKGGPAPTESVVVRANRVIQAVRAAQNDPERTMVGMSAHVDNLSRVAPKTAASYSATTARAISYLSSKIPPNEGNPLRGDNTPNLTPQEASTIAQLGEYIDHPLQFFKDVERGKVTPEGVEMAKILIPGPFQELQLRTMEELAKARQSGKVIPFNERMRLSLLLDIEGDKCLSPSMAAALQEHVSSEPAGDSGPPARASRPIKLQTQPSKFDRLETR